MITVLRIVYQYHKKIIFSKPQEKFLFCKFVKSQAQIKQEANIFQRNIYAFLIHFILLFFSQKKKRNHVNKIISFVFLIVILNAVLFLLPFLVQKESLCVLCFVVFSQKIQNILFEFFLFCLSTIMCRHFLIKKILFLRIKI